MRPWQHARSSGGHGWAQDLPVHEFLDATKTACADRRHRAVLHHVDLGSEIAARVFPDSDVAGAVRSHVTEDLGHPATLADWMAVCDPARLPRPVARHVDGGPDTLADRLRVADALRDAARQVCALLWRPEVLCPGALPLFMHSAGPMIARRVFGPPQMLEGGEVVDFGFLAEAAIFAAFGHIPDLRDVITAWEREP